MPDPLRARLSRAVILLRLSASLPASAALLHGVGATLCGVVLMTEPPAGYLIRVYDGPRALMPLEAWGALFTTCGVFILAQRGAVNSRWALALLAGVWSVFGGGALWVGLTSDQAGSLGGVVFLLLAAGAMRAAWEYDRWPRCTHPSPHGPDHGSGPLGR